ncbi:hypothetical protein ILP92_09945 [Maribius pontilimi]|uniref:D-galactarate dehydratase n=2 Tax=Palleronia pontilimi TaxID=1964209 RepID=A0A934MD09_9RHOB|nr:hypothetical protein [Palleronia pontilimi]
MALSGCAQLPNPFAARPVSGPAPTVEDTPPPPEEIAAIVSAPRPAAAARTVDQFDTTTQEQKAAATAAPTGGETRLGEVVASLGDPTEPGLWIKTPLVTEQRSGRLEYPGSGKSAVVELRPLAGDGGSQVSLAAMRLLEAPLTDLPTLIVYAN